MASCICQIKMTISGSTLGEMEMQVRRSWVGGNNESPATRARRLAEAESKLCT